MVFPENNKFVQGLGYQFIDVIVKSLILIVISFLFLFSISNNLFAEDGIPAGFEDFVEEDETSNVMVYFGRDELGEIEATFNDDELIFDQPDLLWEKLDPYLKKKERDLILQELENPLETNIDRACKDGPECGYITPGVLGIIFDRNNYKVSVFINPLYLVKQTGVKAKFLQDSTAGLSAINQFRIIFQDKIQVMSLIH